jgi:hypothetical protein
LILTIFFFRGIDSEDGDGSMPSQKIPFGNPMNFLYGIQYDQ